MNLYGCKFDKDYTINKAVDICSNTTIDYAKIIFNGSVAGGATTLINGGTAIFNGNISNHSISCAEGCNAEVAGEATSLSISGKGKVSLTNKVRLYSCQIEDLQLQSGAEITKDSRWDSSNYINLLTINGDVTVNHIIYVKDIVLENDAKIIHPENIIFSNIECYMKHKGEGYGLGNFKILGNYTVEGDMEVIGDIRVDSKAIFTIKGNLSQSSGNIYCDNGSKIFIEGNLTQKSGNIYTRGGSNIIDISGDCSTNTLQSYYSNDSIICRGNLSLSKIYSYSNGSIELYGDFIQKGKEILDTPNVNLILKGNQKQNIILTNELDYLGTITNENTSQEGVSVNTFNCSRKLIDEKGTVQFDKIGTYMSMTSLSEDTVIKGDVYLNSKSVV